MNNRQRIETYFEACSTGSGADIAGHFTPDAIVYDTNHKPLNGAAAIGKFWSEIRERWQDARWYVDTCVSDGDCAAIEWTMTGTTAAGAFAVRGSEHYRFRDDLIAEIRQYWTFRRDHLDTALVAFPYDKRTEYFRGA